MSISPRPLNAGWLVAALCASSASAPPPPPVHDPPAAPLLASAVPAGPCREGPAVPADFDGDGAPDLAAGAPHATVGGRFRAGMVAVRYGDGARTVWLSDPHAQRGAGFGAALAAGDFDGDRCADLAVGVPDHVSGRRVSGAEGEGAVQVYLGSRSGLRPAARLTVRHLHRPYGTDRFGAALTAADVDGDRDDELAVGAPGLAGGGGVAVFGSGGRRGLRPGPLVTQRTGWVGQHPAETDGFGTVLTAGDYDGDGRAEIAAGAPDDGTKGQGSVTVLDPLARTARHLTQDGPGIRGAPERLDGFGAALASGDFDRDGRTDLAVGVPGEDLAANASTGYSEGAVQVLAGPSLRQHGPTWTIGRRGGHFDRFGSALAAGDLTGDRTPDLAAGAPGRGAVRVLPGARGRGLSGRGGMTVTAPPGAAGLFGWSLAVHRRDLLVGAPGAAGHGGAVARVTAGRAEVLPLRGRGLIGHSLG